MDCILINVFRTAAREKRKKMVTHHGLCFSNEKELGESAMERKEDRDAGGVLTQTTFHSSEELPQWPQKCKVTTPVLKHNNQNVRSLHSKALFRPVI